MMQFPTNDRVEAFMERKRSEPGFGQRRYSVRTRVGKATITLHKSARMAPAPRQRTPLEEAQVHWTNVYLAREAAMA
jgi:hypothetical protein